MALTGVVDDRYAIERELGRGGMATVYLARDQRQGNRVAIKVLTPDFASVVGGERFSREIRITAGLQHPHILPVFDSGEVDGLPYYVMPFVEGPTIEQKIKRDGALPLHNALEIACEVADALQHAHAQGFVHRDIKPSNILLAHGHAVVADFGIARTVEVASELNLTGTGIAVGTAAYMSPEQAAGEKVDGRSDIYSLGCVLYEMISGHPPFTAATPRALMAMHWREQVPTLASARGPVRPSIDALVRKALAKSANERFQTAGELSEAIQRLSSEERLVSSGFTPPEPDALTSDLTSPVTTISGGGTASAEHHPGSATYSGVSPATHLTGRIESGGDPNQARTNRHIRRRLVLASIAVVVLGAAATAWKVTRPAAPALDSNRILVYPLIVPPDFTGSRSVGEDLGTMIGTALDGTGPLKWIDAWPLLEPAVRQDIRTLSAGDARAIARARRAAYYMMGRVVGRGDSADVFLELNDVTGDSVVARGNAGGLATDAWRIGLRAVNELLPALIPAGVQRADILAEWKDRSPAAVASFLLGEAAFRRVRLAQALGHYRDALNADSTFALAAIRGAQAATWNHRASEAESLIQTAIRQPLTPRYAHFARGYQAYLEGSADSAAAELRRVIGIDPEMAVAWMQLGEVYTHLLPLAGNPDSLARNAFDEAHRLDSTSTILLLHSIEIRLRQAQATEAAPLVRDFLAGEPDTSLATQIRIMYECVRSGTPGVLWTQMARDYPLAVLSASNAFKGGGARLGCAARGFEAVIAADTKSDNAGRRWMAIVGLASTLLAQNKASQAKAQVDTAIAHGWGGATFYLMAGSLFPSMNEAAQAIARKDEATYGANYAACPFNVRLFQLGVWEALVGRPRVAEAVARNLAARADKSGIAADRRFAQSAAAFAALARGDSARALLMLHAIVSRPAPGGDLVWDLTLPRGIERLVLARLLAARGDYRKAIDVANVFDAAWPSIYLLYVPASLELRAGAAAALADKALESRFRERLAALRGGLVVARK